MKANDLRIGNLVSLRTPCTSPKKGMKISIGEIIIIKKNKITVKFLDGFSHSLLLNTFRPIELSKDWLFRFNFSHSEFMKGYIGLETNNTSFILVEPNEFKDFYSFPFTIGGVQMNRKIEFVHELQNLYFALTNKELILND